MSNTNNEKIENNEIIITDYLKLIIKNWYWIILSTIVCCTVAGVYIIITSKTYERTAQIMIKEDSKQGISELDEMSILKEINFFSSKTNINNEVEILRSNKIMKEVIERLHLEKSYKIRSGLKYKELYSKSPIEVTFLDAEEGETFSLIVTPLSEKEIELTSFKVEFARSFDKSIKANILDTITTPLGRLIVSPTLYYNNDFKEKPIHVSKLNAKDITEYLCKNLKVTKSKENTVIKLSLYDNSIQRADDILNTLISVYNEDNITYKNQVVTSTSNFINERIGIIEEELGLVDKDISQYKSSNMVADIKASTNLFITESSVYNKQVFELQNQLSISKFIKEYLTNPANNNNLIPSNSGVNDIALEKQISEYNSYMLKRARLIENGSEKSPAVIELTNALIAMKQSIIRSVDNLIVLFELQIAGIKNREIQTNQKIAGVPEKEMDIISIERRLKIQENLYLYLLQKREENELAGAITTSNFRIVNVAGGDSTPVEPKASLIMLFAFLIGFFAPCTFFFFKRSFETTIKDSKDITNNLTIPFIGSIPQVNQKTNIQNETKKINNYIIIGENKQDAVSEALRIARTNISFMTTKEDAAKTIMLTSFNENAGKSFVALNLAISFALTKKRTILIDLDLRKATLSSLVNSSKAGLSNYLDNKISSLEEIIIKEPFQQTNLDFIPVGKIPSNPVELLLNDEFKKLISELCKIYDHIILDTTAFDVVADASIIDKVSDMTIFVLREDLSDRRKLPELENVYKNDKLNNMTILLNGSHSG